MDPIPPDVMEKVKAAIKKWKFHHSNENDTANGARNFFISWKSNFILKTISHRPWYLLFY
jgi:hypothetical protein